MHGNQTGHDFKRAFDPALKCPNHKEAPLPLQFQNSSHGKSALRFEITERSAALESPLNLLRKAREKVKSIAFWGS